jgi:hypothetical protein
MEIIFDDHHKVAQGDRTKLSPYSYCYDYNLKLSQLAVCITGTPEYILDKLKKMVSEIEERGKPLQGQIVTREGFSSEVITPVWNIVPKQKDDVVKKSIVNVEVVPEFDIPIGRITRIRDTAIQDINAAVDVEDTIRENPPYAG